MFCNIAGDGDAFYCPECKRKQEVVKRMGLWTLPDVLIIHLKRFRQTKSGQNNKLSIMVEFPLENCDMSPFVTEREPLKGSNPASGPNGTTPINPASTAAEAKVAGGTTKLTALFTRTTARKSSSEANGATASPPAEAKINDRRNNIYDLYAVCNHHGEDLQGGHYTATCR